ncbi:putative Transferase hexapeptide repeat containing protein [Candidatus Sulfopaludibacter sp. SbA4]|nr:putative Transferase hexapeptide repeat containing protein [Candidatus Sulfopaludibacter sp. SbA4]
MAWLNAHLDRDWFGAPVPKNIRLGPNVYLESTYAFAAFFSQQDPALTMEEGSGAYGLTSFVVGPQGRVEIGAYTCLSSTAICCEDRIRIGAHCMVAWGAVITDSQVPHPETIGRRRQALLETAADPARRLRPMAEVAPVTIEDNVWVGFDSVIGAGVRIGRGSVVGCKTIVAADVPPYTVMAGNPARVLCRLDPDDTPELRKAVLAGFGLSVPDTPGWMESHA